MTQAVLILWAIIYNNFIFFVFFWLFIIVFSGCSFPSPDKLTLFNNHFLNERDCLVGVGTRGLQFKGYSEVTALHTKWHSFTLSFYFSPVKQNSFYIYVFLFVVDDSIGYKCILCLSLMLILCTWCSFAQFHKSCWVFLFFVFVF